MEQLPQQPDWKRIKRYSNNALKRHTKALVKSMSNTDPFAWFQLPPVNNN